MNYLCSIQPNVIRQQHAGTVSRLATGIALFCLSVFCLRTPAWGFQTQPKSVAPSPRRSTPSKSSSQVGTPALKKSPDPDTGWVEDALKDPELMAEVRHLIEKLQKEVQYPAARNQGAILARLPEATMLYAALPNYGETARQALQILQQGLKESPRLQDLIQKHKLDTAGPQIEQTIEKFYELSQFLGDEWVIAGNLKGQDPSGVLVAQIKKPGLKEFLDKLNTEMITSQSDRLRILDPQTLPAASDKDAAHGPVVLVRPDLVIVGLKVEALREFNAQIDDHKPKFVSHALGQRLAREYKGGANGLLGLDLHKLISLIPFPKERDKVMLEKTGFTDINYLVSSFTMSEGGSASQTELRFTGTRHGIASWIAAPKPMGGLDFVSAHAYIAGDLILKNPVEIFDDLRDFAGEAAFASLPEMEEQFNVNIKRDLLSKLGGEIAFEVEPITSPLQPQATSFVQAAAAPKPGPFKVILSVSDPVGLQQTLTKLLATAPVQAKQRQEDGITFNTITPPSASDTPMEINYFFMDGYLVIASDRATAREAARLHRSGESLAKSAKLRDALTQNQSLNASLIVYEDFGRMMTMLSGLNPMLNPLMSAAGGVDLKPVVFAIEAQESALITRSKLQMNASMPLIFAAAAIPNLLRTRTTMPSSVQLDVPGPGTRTTANESAATAGIRTVVTAQAQYSFSYNGYAPSLAALGPGAGSNCAGNAATATQACLLDDTLANSSCATGKWCVKDGYKFSIRAACLQARCVNYAVTATPVNGNSAAKSFCSTSDAVVRSHSGAPLEAALTAVECKTWAPLR